MHEEGGSTYQSSLPGGAVYSRYVVGRIGADRAMGEHQWEIVERGLSPLAKCHWSQRSVIPGVRPSWEWRECAPPAEAMAGADAVP